MRAFLAAIWFALGLSSAFAQPAIPSPPVLQDSPSSVVWQTVTEWHFNSDNPMQPYVVFVNTATGVGAIQQGVWYSTDLTVAPYDLPLDAKEVYLSGRLIITQPSPGTGDIHMAFRAPGSTVGCPNYQWQTASFNNTSGATARTNMSLHAPVANGRIEYCWTANMGSPGVTYGINLSLQAWGR